MGMTNSSGVVTAIDMKKSKLVIEYEHNARLWELLDGVISYKKQFTFSVHYFVIFRIFVRMLDLDDDPCCVYVENRS